LARTKSKIIITGTGRAGTTFLVQLLTELGLDTGYTPETWPRNFHSHCSAGLEQDPVDPNSPRIVKSPDLCATLADLLASGRITVEHAIIPIRRLDDAARSRIRVGGNGKTPGGLWQTADPETQKPLLAEKFHQLVQTLAAHDIPLTFLDFPRFAQDPIYTREKLHWLLRDIDAATFSAAFACVAHPELIHDFSAGASPDSGQPARRFARVRWSRRMRRRTERILALGAVAVAVWFVSAWWHARNLATPGAGNEAGSAEASMTPDTR